ncbi:hypothetical protein SAPIO_CDS6602 [Scedosporium apiospermum]|uniref:Zn(2)-C6 fungal-type domain-containing protein n=1 Tax=Pseudallescheria apiosperma TaxID=563466 RepID=A0A084G3J4_PSEDA|nr:uncharacterized protein SAPIO_CDS6602 [Scedosporium apiospermum]KEZ41906.1 hypothetical protein SAPIO_CDS6602 [Scedosporium apiospermum]
MPRRSHPETVEKRGRNACWKCKERRIRCTLERPICSNCARGKHVCKYGRKLLWREEALARGICFGRQGISGRTPEVPIIVHHMSARAFQGKVYFLNITLDDYIEPGCGTGPAELGQNEQAKCTGEGLGEPTSDSEDRDEEIGAVEEDPPFDTTTNGDPVFHSPYPSQGLSMIPSAQNSTDFHLFDFFVSCLCPNLSNSTTENPYWEFVVPLSFSSVPLFHALLAWAGHEASFANQAEKYRYNVASVKYKLRALRGLRNEITAMQGEWLDRQGNSPPDNWASILATIIILSCTDIAEMCSPEWMDHLRAARVLCNLAWPRRPGLPDKFRKFCVMWFVSHDIMSRTAWIRENIFEPSEWFAGDEDTEIDPMIACSRGLLQQVSAIGTLILNLRARRVTLSEIEEEEEAASFRRRRDAIEEALQALHQRSSTDSDGSESTGELLQVAESKRLCALIYLYACADGATPASPVIQGLTRRVIGIMGNLTPKPSVIFPLFVVGTMGDEVDSNGSKSTGYSHECMA